MPHLRLFSSLALLLTVTSASATSFIATTDTLGRATVGTSDSTTDASSDDDDKLLLAARDDAASFVASGGAIRGAHLEAALTRLRTKQPQLAASDLQLAQAILAADAH